MTERTKAWLIVLHISMIGWACLYFIAMYVWPWWVKWCAPQ